MLRWGIVLGFCLTVSAFAAPGEIDRRFKPKLPANAHITAVFEQNNARLLVAGTIAAVPGIKALPSPFLLRLRANGQLDQTFRPPRSGLVISSISEITERPDGIGVIGSFRAGAEGPMHNAVVFQRNGKLAPYTPAVNFSKGTWLPDGGIAFDGFQLGHNGRIGFLDANGAGPVYVDTPFSESQFVWLRGLPEGDVIGFLFRPAPVPPGQPGELIYSMRAGGFEFRDEQTPVPVLGLSNTLYLATDRLILWRGTGPFLYQLPDAIEPRLPRAIPCIAPQSDGSVVYSLRYPVHGTNFIFRCAPDGANDESFPTLLPNGPVNGLLALRNGQTLAWGDFTEINGVPVKSLVRLNAE